jgi:hypothetical protein
MEKNYLLCGFCLVVFSILILKIYWEKIPEKIVCSFNDKNKYENQVIRWCDKEVLMIYLIPNSIGFLADIVFLKIIPPELLKYDFWPVKKNAETRYRIARSLICWLSISNGFMFIILEIQNIQFVLGEIKEISPLILQLTMGVWMPAILLCHYYFHFRCR